MALEALRAGAVAIKQYAWYYTMHYRGGTGTGGCYDVVDNSNDQIYAPEKETPATSHIQAVESTWSESLTRNGAFVFTGYRPGSTDVCAADVTAPTCSSTALAAAPWRATAASRSCRSTTVRAW